MMDAMTDLHQHLLWGLDDGPTKQETTYAMLDEAYRQRIRRIYATPHACPGLAPFDMGLYRERLAQAQQYCRDQKLDITLLPGAEVEWSFNTVNALRSQHAPTLGDTDYVLIELWPNVTWPEVRDAAKQLLRAFYTPVFAHVERYRCFVWQPEQALRLRDELGVLYQVNASTVIHHIGPMTKRFVKRLLNEQAVDVIASDAHNCTSRPQCMAQAYEALLTRCPSEYAAKLVNFQGGTHD